MIWQILIMGLFFFHSVKMIGLFVVAAVGIAVIMDLWELLDIKYGLSTKNLAQHFGARAVGLILVPSIIYIFWFYIHFAILNHSGSGDAFMSAQFQNTLSNSPTRMQSLGKK
jgi:dolichyl-phosphate-mannose-protein mannosyltransferase